jgi:arginine utilization protein RocB
LFRGRPSHAGAAFDGVNPSLLSSEFVRRVECAPALLGSGPDSAIEPPPVPTVLYHRDLRKSYDVTSPASVFVSLNVLTHEASPGAILDGLGREALGAMRDALRLLEGRAQEQSRLSGTKVELRSPEARLLRWSELEAETRIRNLPAFEAARQALLAALALGSTDAPNGPVPAVAAYVDACLDLAGIEGPLAVIGLAPPYYPRAALSADEAALASRLAEVTDSFSRAHADSPGGSIVVRPFFPGISDMSYLCPADPPEARREAAAEDPTAIASSPPDTLTPFRCPAINVGPWGRDYHQRLERLHTGYAFDLLPEFVARLAAQALG